MSIPVVAVDTLVIGAGISGLSFAGFYQEACRRHHLDPGTLLIVDKEREPGGYCRTIKQDGFVWDYSGHFFHFRHADLQQRLLARMPEGSVATIKKCARVVDAFGCETSFPYQRAMGELPPDIALQCLRELFLQQEQAALSTSAVTEPVSFKTMLQQRLGNTLCERFLVPYNEKLYATDLNTLDAACMGRFFPTTTFADAMHAVAHGNVDTTYNSTFSYPRGGAVEYVNALLHDVDTNALALEEEVLSIHRTARKVRTSKRELSYQRLITSAPLPRTLEQTDVAYDASAFTKNRVLVLNLGFDSGGRTDVHWLYFAARELQFYRVGFYSTIFGDQRLSLYVEIGLPSDGAVDVDDWLEKTLIGLQRCKIITQQKLISWHAILMDPAYCHITTGSQREATRTRTQLARDNIFSIGRYGAWTYCSIEDNMIEARALADSIVTERMKA